MNFIQGGIGDLLQALPKAIEKQDIAVYSHYPDADNIFTPFRVNVRHLTQEQIQQMSAGLVETERSLFLTGITTPKGSINEAIRVLKDIDKPIIGIHPIGSKFSNQFWFQRGKPIKYMPKEFLERITSDQKYFYLIFGTDEEIDEYTDILDVNMMPVSCSHIWDTFAFVDFCDKVVGVDSAIKSYSSMRKIPTLVLLGDYEDEFRDEHFINPYIDAKVMDVIKFTQLGEKEAEAVGRWLNGSKIS